MPVPVLASLPDLGIALGLNDMARDEEVAALLNRHPSSPDACDALVALALERGGKDNVTVVVARYALDEPRPPSGEVALDPA